MDREKTYRMPGQKNRYAGECNFVSEGNAAEAEQFYNKGNIASIIGGLEFKNSQSFLVNEYG